MFWRTGALVSGEARGPMSIARGNGWRRGGYVLVMAGLLRPLRLPLRSVSGEGRRRAPCLGKPCVTRHAGSGGARVAGALLSAPPISGAGAGPAHACAARDAALRMPASFAIGERVVARPALAMSIKTRKGSGDQLIRSRNMEPAAGGCGPRCEVVDRRSEIGDWRYGAELKKLGVDFCEFH